MKVLMIGLSCFVCLLTACSNPGQDTVPGADNGLIPEEVLSKAVALPASDNFGLYMYDAPGDFTSVLIVVGEVSVHRSKPDAGWVMLDDGTTPKEYDLMTLTDGVSALLGSAKLDPGTYGQVRLEILDGSKYSLEDGSSGDITVPSDKLKFNLKSFEIKENFEVEEEDTSQLVALHFDPVKALICPGSAAEANDKANDKAAGGKPDDVGQDKAVNACKIKPNGIKVLQKEQKAKKKPEADPEESV